MADRGRPKKSSNVACTCKVCGKTYEVPEWRQSGRTYCSRACFHLDRVGKPSPNAPIEPEQRTCSQCGKEFLVGGRGRPPRTATFCSLACAAAAKGYQAAPRALKDTDAAWLAGIFDGEGTIAFPRKGYLSSRISIVNTNKALIDRIVEVTGTGRVFYRTHANPDWNDTWTWQCYATNARNLLRQMLPWLIVKKEKALIALSKE